MRLTSRLLRRLGRRRLADERGAVAVLVALMLVPLLGFAAIAVDVASLYSDREQLRTAADAAALAVAADCAKGACANPTATAAWALTANADPAGATLRTPAVSVSGQQVTVTMTADQAHWFAPVLGIDSTTVSVTSAATWTGGTPLTRTLRAPVGLSWCEYQAQLARGQFLNSLPHHLDPQTTAATTCTGPDGEALRGGQAVLQPDAANGCLITASTGSNVTKVRPALASRVAGDCASGLYKLGLLWDQVVLPVWDQTGTSNGTTWYRVRGFVTFELWNIELANATPMLTGRFTSPLVAGPAGVGSVSLVREK